MRRQLLIVEDEKEIQEILVEQLRALDICIECADNGQHGLQKLSATHFDAVLSDIRMPVMTGLELLTEAQRKTVPPPFVFLTGFNDQDFILQALRIGAIDFLMKPFDAKDLLQVISRAIEIGVRRKAIAELRGEPDSATRIEQAEKMIALFRLNNNSKRSSA